MYLIFREFGVGDAIDYYELGPRKQIVIEGFLSYLAKEQEEVEKSYG